MKALLLLSLLAISFVVSSCNSYLRREDVVDFIKVADQLLSLEVDQIMEILDNDLVGIQPQPTLHRRIRRPRK